MKKFSDLFKKATSKDIDVEKQTKQAQAAIRTHKSAVEGEILDQEALVEDAKDALEKAKANGGFIITDRKTYVQGILTATSNLKEQEANLEDLKEKLAVLVTTEEELF